MPQRTLTAWLSPPARELAVKNSRTKIHKTFSGKDDNPGKNFPDPKQRRKNSNAKKVDFFLFLIIQSGDFSFFNCRAAQLHAQGDTSAVVLSAGGEWQTRCSRG